MKIAIAVVGLASRLARARTERMRADAVSSALRELARRATPTASDVPLPLSAAGQPAAAPSRDDPEETRS